MGGERYGTERKGGREERGEEKEITIRCERYVDREREQVTKGIGADCGTYKIARFTQPPTAPMLTAKVSVYSVTFGLSLAFKAEFSKLCFKREM